MRPASEAIMQRMSRSAGMTATLAAVLWTLPTGFATAQAPRAPHPEPRVIVNVLSVRGPHERSAVERSARLAWGRIVGCYNALGEGGRGRVEIELAISSDGRVTGARRTHSTLKTRELERCLASTMRRVSMPKASGRSSALTEIHVAPGDRT
jgi:hypothetical protein